MPQDPLERVRRTAAKATTARAELEAAIVAAHAGGASLRAIAAAAGTNHEAIRVIVARQERPQ
jgi:hypothetical protein